jgi:hypothetical protein
LAIPIEKCTAKANASRTFATEIREKVLPNGDLYFEAQICAPQFADGNPDIHNRLGRATVVVLPRRVLLFDLDQVVANRIR